MAVTARCFLGGQGFSAHFEHSIAILKDRTEIMTRSWDDPNFDPDTFSFK